MSPAAFFCQRRVIPWAVPNGMEADRGKANYCSECVARLRQGFGGQFSFRFEKKTGGGDAISTRTKVALITAGQHRDPGCSAMGEFRIQYLNPVHFRHLPPPPSPSLLVAQLRSGCHRDPTPQNRTAFEKPNDARRHCAKVNST